MCVPPTVVTVSYLCRLSSDRNNLVHYSPSRFRHQMPPPWMALMSRFLSRSTMWLMDQHPEYSSRDPPHTSLERRGLRLLTQNSPTLRHGFRVACHTYVWDTFGVLASFSYFYSGSVRRSIFISRCRLRTRCSALGGLSAKHLPMKRIQRRSIASRSTNRFWPGACRSPLASLRSFQTTRMLAWASL